MTVKCKVTECPWIIGGMFCSKGFVFINQNGTCNWLYNGRGEVRQNWRDKGEERSGKVTKEEKEGAGAGSVT